MKRSQFMAMQARRKAEGLPPYGKRWDKFSGETERQTDLLNDLSHGRIDLQEYRELGGKHR